ncbi:MAG: hypothetical protein H6719_30405 [Sandaracinaceae bacterium]|nr:hypothetical protein [Sandaracinaceae bacterium]
MARTICAALALVTLGGCAMELAEDDGWADTQYLSPDDCYPRGNRFNCRPDSASRYLPRVYNPVRGGIYWPIAHGTPLYDGVGSVRGVVRDGQVRINHGQRKRLAGQTMVYVWAVRLEEGFSASGWVPEAALVHRRTLRRRMPTVRLPNPGRGHYQARWTVTGGDPAHYGDLTVTRGYRGDGRRATDYLMRPGDVVNLTYNVPGRELGGYNVDTFRPGVTFRRARGVQQLAVPLYRQGGTTAVDHLHFIYGYVHDGTQRRYGWMAREALRLTSEAPADATCAARCCDGSVVTALDASSERACIASARTMCEAHESSLRVRRDGALVYQRGRSCWARCPGDAAYARLAGVTEGCTERAVEYCGGRGLEDAMWASCAPR